MNALLWPFRILYTVYVVLLFAMVILAVFPFVIVASFWGKVKGGNFVYRLLRICSFFWFRLIGIFPGNIYEHRPDRNRQYIFVANHISYLDAALIVETVKQPFRPLGKIEMSRIPVFGFIYRVCVVMVERTNADHRAKSVRQLKSVLKKGISILVFPEGTFNETNQPLKDFYDGAFRVAIETQTPIQPILFLDSYDRMHYKHIFSMTPGRCRAIFLQPVEVAGMDTGQIRSLRERVYIEMDKKLREYRASWIVNRSSNN